MDISTIVFVLAVTLLASLIRFSIGFGNALVAMPLLALVMDLRVATPLTGLTSLTIALIMAISHREHIDLASTGKLVLYSALGIPIGLLFLRGAHEPVVKAALAVVIILFAGHGMVQHEYRRFRAERFAWLFGLAAGILGGAYNTNGPPVVLYASLRGWPSDRFRGTLQGYFLPSCALILLGQGAAGLLTRHVLDLYVLCLPAILLALLVGQRLQRVIPEHAFGKCIKVFLILVGLALLIDAATLGRRAKTAVERPPAAMGRSLPIRGQPAQAILRHGPRS